MKFAIIAPENYTSGGPEALHQLADKINYLGHEAFMLYTPFDNNPPVPDKYRHYKCTPISRNDIGTSGWIIIIPEIYQCLIHDFGGHTRCFWWLSKNYGPPQWIDEFTSIDIHLCQSQYAFEHVSTICSGEHLMLTDYVSPVVFNVERPERTIDVATNPLKGREMADEFFSLNSSFSSRALTGLSHSDVGSVLSRSKLFIDFGEHPGRDRIPREASLCGCCVLVKSAGAAAFQQDVPLDNFYKFSSVEEVSQKANQIISDGLGIHVQRQSTYREWIEHQEHTFTTQVSNLILKLSQYI